MMAFLLPPSTCCMTHIGHCTRHVCIVIMPATHSLGEEGCVWAHSSTCFSPPWQNTSGNGVRGIGRGCSQLSTQEAESKEEPAEHKTRHITIKGLPLVAFLPARPHLQKASHLSKHHHPWTQCPEACRGRLSIPVRMAAG